MKILILVNGFPPEIRSVAHLFYELAESLVNLGHQVTVVTGFPSYAIREVDKKYRHKLFLREKMNNVNVIRLATIPLPRTIPMVRTFSHFFEAISFFIGGLLSRKQDVVLIYSPPLTLGISGYFLKRLKKIPFFFNMQDVYPQCLIDIGILKNPVIIAISRLLEKWVYKRVDYFTVYSDGNKQHLLKNNVPDENIIIIPNWVDTDTIKPSERLNNFRRNNDLGTSFIVSFAGVMGYAQGLDAVIHSAKIIEEYKNILFLLVGDGVEKPKLENMVQEMDLQNVKFLPMQPKHIYPQVLAASDVCLVTLKGELKTAIPGKLQSIMASGRPVLASVDLSGEVPKVIKAAKCGYCVESDNPEELAKAIINLYEKTNLREKFGKNARSFAEKHFSRNVCISKYDQAFFKAVKEF
ncbi:glycosyltransferase [Candidatus Poribacteria bacterium]|nr:glycosyltransferase [Candidatus Poribacteria bacterium]